MSELTTPSFWNRLVVTLPLNGELTYECERIYIRECSHPNLVTINKVFLRVDQHDNEYEHDTLEEALRVALSNSGWGTYRITNVTN